MILYNTTIMFRTVRINRSKEGKRGYDEYENVCNYDTNDIPMILI